MAKANKRVAARLPRGFEDRYAADIAATDKMIATIREVYERYGFDPVETPFFEYTEALGKFLPDEDRPNQGVFSLQDDDEQWMSLRYDLTAPLARHFSEIYQDAAKPYRTYRLGFVFRNEKPGPGRFRQFMQFDADTVGAAGPEADAEMCMMMADTMDALGLEGKYVVRVNNRKVLDGVLEAAGVTDEGQKLTVLRAIDKLDKVGIEGVKLLLGEGRKDESGDFTKGAGLSETSQENILRLVDWDRVVHVRKQTDSEFVISSVEVADDPEGAAPRTNSEQLSLVRLAWGYNKLCVAGADELDLMNNLFASAGYDENRIRIDPSVVRGLEYYTGPVFEIELTFPVTNEKGQEVVFGSVGGGGRYDGLVSRFRPEATPATGFSIGVSRLATALKLTGNLGTQETCGPVVVLVMDRDQVAGYQKMVSDLRKEGVRAELFLGSTKNFGKQVAYADKRNSPCVIIEGSDERVRGVVQIKDLIEGKKAAEAIKDNAEWKSERPGQFEVNRADLVDEVKKLLATYGIGKS
ncbi:MAG: histidine--tRNA ligase [Hyphomicrobiaceae bacterium]|nr:histidine--tRNA ligase [Hyphomicrobiaceae bacterium]